MDEAVSPLPNLVQRTRVADGDELVYTFGNGLTVHTEVFMKDDPLRVLPIGTPQDTLINWMLNHPEHIAGKTVFEPFAGSGVLGLMALKLGARHVDFLDINPRAVEFQVANAQGNGFAPTRYRAIEKSIAVFEPECRYDLIFSNPPSGVGTNGGLEKIRS